MKMKRLLDWILKNRAWIVLTIGPVGGGIWVGKDNGQFQLSLNLLDFGQVKEGFIGLFTLKVFLISIELWIEWEETVYFLAEDYEGKINNW